ncbi:MAG: HAMP domain-containing histidine kinase [Methylococcaceae bacterium]|nr:MAG: HAMP domain-containing histidine kinase [Methylococcaceae bacterium]
MSNGSPQHERQLTIAMGAFILGVSRDEYQAAHSLCESQHHLMTAVTHDLKSPLNAILGLSGMLRDQLTGKCTLTEDESRDILESIDMINSAGLGMLRLIADILTMARIEAGKEPIDPVETSDLGGMLQHIAKTFRLEAGSHKIDFSLRVTEPLPTVYWDTHKIQFHVINNVVANALKFTPNGGRVELRAGIDDDGVIIAIADSGPGIAVEERDRIFERYARLDVKSERVYQGSGLGLYNAQLIVRQHGGRITIGEGLDGCGTTFYIGLPIRAEARSSQ